MLSLFGLSSVFNRDLPRVKSYKLSQFIDLIQNAPVQSWHLQNTKATSTGFVGEFVNSAGESGYTNFSAPTAFHQSKIIFRFSYRRGKFCEVKLEVHSLIDKQVAVVDDPSLNPFLNLLIKRSFPFIPGYLKDQLYGVDVDSEPGFVLV